MTTRQPSSIQTCFGMRRLTVCRLADWYQPKTSFGKAMVLTSALLPLPGFSQLAFTADHCRQLTRLAPKTRPPRVANQAAHEVVDVLRVLRDKVKIHAPPAVLCKHAHILWWRTACRANREIIVAFVHQKDGAVRLGLPVLDVDFLPRGQFAAGHGLETAVVADRAVFCHAALAHPLEGVERFARAVCARDKVEHVPYLRTKRLNAPSLKPLTTMEASRALNTMVSALPTFM